MWAPSSSTAFSISSDQPAAEWRAGVLISQLPPRFISPPNDFGTDLIGSDTLTFLSGGSTDAIGFFVLSAGLRTTYVITVVTRTNTTLVEPLLGEPSPVFRGFVASEGIVSVTIAHANPVNRINFSVDDVSRGALTPIPEPSTALLLGVGSIFACRRAWAGVRRGRRASSRT